MSGRVQSQLGVCETRYYQLLAGLLDRPEAEGPGRRFPNGAAVSSPSPAGMVAPTTTTAGAGDPLRPAAVHLPALG